MSRRAIFFSGLISIAACSTAVFSQTGPAGVGSSTTNKLWLKANTITGVSDGGDITTWDDESGNNYDFTQGTSTKRPSWDQSNANFNNKSTVSFDGVDEYFNNTSTINSASNFDIFIVYKTTSTVIQYLLNSSTGTLIIPHQGSGTNKAYDDGSARGTEITGTGTKLVQWNLNSTGSSIYEGGTQSQSGLSYTQRAISTSTSAGANAAGSSRFVTGDIAELIVCNTNLNSAQRIIVENYLGNKYGITIANDKYAYQSTHSDDIAGIGRVDASNQHTAAESAKIFKASSASSLGDADYLLFGHDNGAINSWSTTEAPCTEIRRLAREWRLDVTGDVGTITITLDTAVLAAHTSGYNGYVCMVDADGDFSSGAKIYSMTSAGGSTYSVSSLSFSDGDYVTFGCARNVYRGTGNFNVAGNWLGGSIPGTGAMAVISSNATVTLTANTTVGELIVATSGSINLSSYTLYIDNNSITNSGTFTVGTSTVNYSKGGTQNIAALTYNNLAVSGSGIKTLAGSITVSGNLTISAGTLDASAYGITLGGNFVNSAAFTGGTGTVTFNGSSNQQLTSNGSSFYNLVVVNTATQVSLNDNVTISNLLTLTDGVITTGASYKVIISSSSSASMGGYSSASFINGNLRRYIASNTDTYVFPVGNGTGTTNYYRADVLNGSLTGITYIDSKFKALTGHLDSQMDVWDNWENGNLVYNTINIAGVWELKPNATPSGGSYGVKLYTANMSGLTDNDFGPLKRPVGSTTGADWSTGGGTLNNNDSDGRTVASGYMQRSGLTGFSEFGGGGGSGQGAGLPIELIIFQAVVIDNTVRLEWKTATETNNDFFTVERSKDGDIFEELGVFEAAGNSFVENEYSAIDRKPLKGIGYYRLKQTDFDGEFTYSDIIAVNLDLAETDFSLSPNPVTGRTITISTSSGICESKCTLQLTDMSGRNIALSAFELSQEQTSSIQLPDFIKPGLYFFSLQDGSNVYHRKIVVN